MLLSLCTMLTALLSLALTFSYPVNHKSTPHTTNLLKHTHRANTPTMINLFGNTGTYTQASPNP